MKNYVWKLENVIQYYQWGSKTALSKLFNIENKQHQPQAEIWMGVHPAGCSTAVNSHGQKKRLDELIATNPVEFLGPKTCLSFHTLPFLFKVLAAEKPLSVQVHPKKNNAEKGFAKENRLGIALNADNRNYKDPNHKPELIYAITPFKAMNGFRPIDEILHYFSLFNCPFLSNEVSHLAQNQTPTQLKLFFETLLTLSGERKNMAICQLLQAVNYHKDPIAEVVRSLAQDYPTDIGLFTPLLLNVIDLKPQQAMYLDAETPHAYLHGVGMEIMANSDNVLRAGLTPKYIDVAELLNNTHFHSIALPNLLTEPCYHDNCIDFPVPVSDFKFSIINSENEKKEQMINSAEIVFCITGQINIETPLDNWTIKAGESLFIACSASKYYYSGHGQLARAYN